MAKSLCHQIKIGLDLADFYEKYVFVLLVFDDSWAVRADCASRLSGRTAALARPRNS